MALPSLSMGGRSPKQMMPMLAIVGGLGVGGLLLASQFHQIQSLQGQLAQNRQVIARLEQENQQLLQRVTESEARRADLDKKLTALRGELSSAGTTLERSRVSLEEMQSRYGDLEQVHRDLERKFEGVTAERDEATKRAQALAQEKAELERTTVHMRERLALVERDFERARDQLTRLEQAPRSDLAVINVEGPAAGPGRQAAAEQAVPSTAIAGAVELPPIVVRKDQAGMSLPVRGRIVEVNEPHNFIVLDQGTQDGVHVGMSFDLVRGGGAVGKATVVRVRPNLAACDLVRTKTPSLPQVGDQAVQAGP